MKKNKTVNTLKSYMKPNINEAGIDEVGRGCLAGPVVSAAVILPDDFNFELIKDSKKLNEKQRLEAVNIIKQHAIAWGIGYRSSNDIDERNILKCTYESMHSALDKLIEKYNIKVDHLLIDGNSFNGYNNIPHTCVIKGDAKYYSIAAASILAKVTRDEYMKKLSIDFPGYGWETNFGYGTKKHRDFIIESGPTKYHRMSFLGNILPKDANSLF